MADCKITSGFTVADCNALEKGGVSGVMYLINYSAWLSATITKDVDGSISAITLTESGEQAYKYELTRGASVLTSPAVINNGGKSGYQHTANVFIPTKGMDQKTQFSNLLNFGRVVAIFVLDSTVVSNVYGDDMGLSMTAYEEAPNDPGKGGGIQVTLQTPADTTLESLPPVTFFDTDRATTLDALTALETPVV
jgi:hypothetical protein